MSAPEYRYRPHAARSASGLKDGRWSLQISRAIPISTSGPSSTSVPKASNVIARTMTMSHHLQGLLSLPSPPEVAQKADGAFIAGRRRAAQRLRMGDEERVVLPVHREVSRHAGFEVLLDVVVRVRVGEADSPTNSNRVCGYEVDGMAADVEEDGIRRLWPHAVLCEQVVSDYVRRSIEISRQVAIRSIQQVAAEVTEPFRFGPIQARDFHVSPNDRHRGRRKIGRASCRERVESSVEGGWVEKKYERKEARR